jgi:hypothetical protein
MTKEEKAAKAQTDALIDQLLAKSGITREAVLGEGGGLSGVRHQFLTAATNG